MHRDLHSIRPRDVAAQLIVTCAQLDHADAPLALTERTE